MWDAVYPYAAALLPTIGILVLFYIVMKNIIEADRRERRAQAEWDAARAREAGQESPQPGRSRPTGAASSADPDPDDNNGR